MGIPGSSCVCIAYSKQNGAGVSYYDSHAPMHPQAHCIGAGLCTMYTRRGEQQRRTLGSTCHAGSTLSCCTTGAALHNPMANGNGLWRPTNVLADTCMHMHTMHTCTSHHIITAAAESQIAPAEPDRPSPPLVSRIHGTYSRPSPGQARRTSTRACHMTRGGGGRLRLEGTSLYLLLPGRGRPTPPLPPAWLCV